MVDHRQLFEGAGDYRVRINRVTYYLVTTKETEKKKTKHARRSKVQSTSGDSEEALRFEGNRPTPTKADAATASFSVADKNATPAERLKIWTDFP